MSGEDFWYQSAPPVMRSWRLDSRTHAFWVWLRHPGLRENKRMEVFYFSSGKGWSLMLFRHVSRYPGKIRFFLAASFENCLKNDRFFDMIILLFIFSTQNKLSKGQTKLAYREAARPHLLTEYLNFRCGVAWRHVSPFCRGSQFGYVTDKKTVVRDLNT